MQTHHRTCDVIKRPLCCGISSTLFCLHSQTYYQYKYLKQVYCELEASKIKNTDSIIILILFLILLNLSVKYVELLQSKFKSIFRSVSSVFISSKPNRNIERMVRTNILNALKPLLVCEATASILVCVCCMLAYECVREREFDSRDTIQLLKHCYTKYLTESHLGKIKV